MINENTNNNITTDIFNIEKLKPNVFFNTYKDLCVFFEMENFKSGTSRKKQTDEIERFCALSKNGHGFSIKEVYDVPYPPTNNYGSSPYGKLTELILCDLLLQHEHKFNGNSPFIVSINDLAKKIGFVNYLFSYYNKHPWRFSKNNQIPKTLVDEMFHKIKRSYSGAIKTVLNKMQNNQKLIICDEITFIAKVDKNKVEFQKVSNIDKYGDEITFVKVINDDNLTFQAASDQEKQKIIAIQQQVLKTIECQNMQDVFSKGLQNKYYQLLQNSLVMELGVLFYYKAYNISFVKEYIYTNKNNLIKEIKKLNNTFLNNLLKIKYKNSNREGFSNKEDDETILKSIECFCEKLVRYNYDTKEEYKGLTAHQEKNHVSQQELDGFDE